MTNNEFDKAVKLLPKLSAKQLDTLSSRLHALRTISGKASTTKTDGKRALEDRALDTLCAAMRKLGVECPSPNMLRRSSQFPAFKQKLPDLFEYIAKVGEQRVKQDALLQLAFELLYYDLVNVYEIAASSHSLMAQVHRVPAVINRHFPGYAISGALGCILKIV